MANLTADQIQAFMEWVEARIALAIEEHVRRDAGQEMLAERAAREAVYASLGFNGDGTPPEKAKPAVKWDAVAHPQRPYGWAIKSSTGEWCKDDQGEVKFFRMWKTARRNAVCLNVETGD